VQRYSVINEQHTGDLIVKHGSCEMDKMYSDKENVLTAEQVNVCTGEDFEVKQLREIRLGFENDLSMEQILIYADPKYKWFQMREIRLGFENGLSMEQVLTYSDSKYNKWQMEQLRNWFEFGLTIKQIKLIDIDCLDVEQKNEIDEMINMGLPTDEVEERINRIHFYNKRSKLINKFVRQYKKENKILTKEELDKLLDEAPDKIKIKCKK